MASLSSFWRKMSRALVPYRARLHALLRSRLDPSAVTAIVILGNQKTGSTAVAHLLASYGQLSLAADVHPAQGNEQRLVNGTYPLPALLQDARYYFRHEVVKENALTPITEPLLNALPHARFVFMTRHPAHNIRSMLDRLSLPGEPLPLSEINVDPGWQSIVDGSALHLDAPDHISALALRWQTLADRYLDHQDRLQLIRYEDFQTDKTGTIARLAEQLGVPQRTDIQRLLDRPFQPRGAHRTVPLEEFFSEDALRIIDQHCAAGMHALDYTPTLTRSSS